MHDIYNVVSTPSTLVNFTPLTKHFQYCDAIMYILFHIVSKLNTYVSVMIRFSLLCCYHSSRPLLPVQKCFTLLTKNYDSHFGSYKQFITWLYASGQSCDATIWANLPRELPTEIWYQVSLPRSFPNSALRVCLPCSTQAIRCCW